MKIPPSNLSPQTIRPNKHRPPSQLDANAEKTPSRPFQLPTRMVFRQKRPFLWTRRHGKRCERRFFRKCVCRPAGRARPAGMVCTNLVCTQKRPCARILLIKPREKPLFPPFHTTFVHKIGLPLASKCSNETCTQRTHTTRGAPVRLRVDAPAAKGKRSPLAASSPRGGGQAGAGGEGRETRRGLRRWGEGQRARDEGRETRSGTRGRWIQRFSGGEVDDVAKIDYLRKE